MGTAVFLFEAKPPLFHFKTLPPAPSLANPPPKKSRMASVFAFVSNRGGVGKSTLVSQLAPVVAAANPSKTVLVIDLSIQGDTSVNLLGGVQAPAQFNPGVRTLGDEKMLTIDSQSSALGLINALSATMGQAPTRSFWRGGFMASSTATTITPIDYAVSVKDKHPAGKAPSNLYISYGGPNLYGQQINPVSGAADKLRAGFAKMDNCIVLIDTDAELSERPTSLLGIAVAQKIILVLSPHWADYSRLLQDPANGIFLALAFLKQNDSGFKGKIAGFLFNNVSKRLNDGTNLCGVPALPFTPPNDEVAGMTEISSHMFQMAIDMNSMLSDYFLNWSATTAGDFVRTYVSAIGSIPTTVIQPALAQGIAVINMPTTPPQAASRAQFEAVAAKCF